ncbi:MAG TPA: GGDEF domain-containing response regulator [Solirubrobacteraceae bacterium]|jgi:diguanylate cyclase (GGDEF)-like protein|nr:GGDEF domain-containing response regulator [Solirubrobacteraceae bacterium]
MTVSEAAVKPAGPPPQARPVVTGLSIMIVEDTPGDARLTAELLREHDPSLLVTTCERVDDAARALASAAPDCVLLDLGLPDPDGLDHIDRLDAPGGIDLLEGLDGLNQILAAAPGVPVVVLTGVDDDRLALAAVGRGAQDYVAKHELAAAQLWRAINRAIERARVTRELIRRATHDSLTGLPNRALFEDRIGQTIVRSGRLDTGFSVMLVSIDGLKSLNDNFGHALGDEVLREISRRLEGVLDDGDTAYRYAGAEFAVICQSAEHPVGATSIAEGIRDAICLQAVVVGVRSLNIGAAIGVAIGSSEETPASLLHRLDGAIYEARLTGGACVVD